MERSILTSAIRNHRFFNCVVVGRLPRHLGRNSSRIRGNSVWEFGMLDSMPRMGILWHAGPLGLQAHRQTLSNSRLQRGGLAGGLPGTGNQVAFGVFMKKTKSFGAVGFMRTVRDVMSQEMRGLTFRQHVEYIEKRSGLKRPAKGVEARPGHRGRSSRPCRSVVAVSSERSSRSDRARQQDAGRSAQGVA